LLYKHQCIRTQKKQKVFLWFSVPHDRLFLDALERDLKRERAGQDITTEVAGEPAQSFAYDPSKSIVDQFTTTSSSTSTSDEADTNLLGRFTSTEGPEGYKQRRPNRVKARQHSSHDDDDGASPDNSSPEYEDPVPQQQEYAYSHPHMGYGYSAYDQDLNASDMFVRQASGQFARQLKEQRADAARRKEEERERKEHDELVKKQERARTAAEEQAKEIRERLKKEKGPASQEGELVDVEDELSVGSRGSLGEGGFGYSFATTSGTSSPYQSTIDLGASSQSGSFGSMPVPGQQTNATASSSSATAPGVSTQPAEQNKLFPCPLFSCGRAFKRAEHLRRHLRTHTAERPFVCTSCEKRFARSDNLAQHMRTHTRAAVTAGPSPGGETTEVEYATGWGNNWEEMDDGMSESSSGGISGAGLAEDQHQQQLSAGQWSQSGFDNSVPAHGSLPHPLLNSHGRSGSFSSDGSGPGPTHAHVVAPMDPLSAPSTSLAFDQTALTPPSGLGDRRLRSLTPSYPSSHHGQSSHVYDMSSNGQAIRRPRTAAVRERASIHGSSAFSPYALAALTHARSAQNSPSHNTIGLPGSNSNSNSSDAFMSAPNSAPVASGMVGMDFAPEYAPSLDQGYDLASYTTPPLQHPHPHQYPHHATYPPASMYGSYPQQQYQQQQYQQQQQQPRSVMSYPSSLADYASTNLNFQNDAQPAFGMPAYAAEPETMAFDASGSYNPTYGAHGYFNFSAPV
jgi:hypothetical protein